MCKFFSCVSNGKGKIFYFNAAQRAELKRSNPRNYDPDSHTSIADFYGYRGSKEDTLNKYEFNPLTQEFTIDQINTKDDSISVERKLKKLDFKTIVPELVIKPIINPLTVLRKGDVTDQELELLRQWASVRASVRASVWASVRASVWDSVGASVRDSVWDSVWDSVEDSVWDSVGVSVGASVRASVRASVWASVRGYISGFFCLREWKYIKHVPGENPFQSCIDLWKAGLVPSFDGKVWRLHAGPKAEVVWQGMIDQIVAQ